MKIENLEKANLVVAEIRRAELRIHDHNAAIEESDTVRLNDHAYRVIEVRDLLEALVAQDRATVEDLRRQLELL